MKTFAISILALAALLFASPVAAQVPGTISVQGVVQTAEKPLNGAFPCVIHLYDSPTGGSALAMETHNVNFENSLFTLYLGQFAALNPFLFSKPLWVALYMNNEEMRPRIPLSSVPYAFAVPDSTVTVQKLSKRGSLVNQSLVATEKGVEWQNIVNKIIPGGQFYLTPREGVGNVRINLAPYSITADFIADFSIPPRKLHVESGNAPSEGSVLTYTNTNLGPRFKWSEGGAASDFLLPYSGTLDKSVDLFTITHPANGRAGRFVVSTAASDSPALQAESKGSGSSFYAEATGIGHSGEFRVNNANSNASSLTAFSNGKGAAAEAFQTSPTGNVVGISGFAASTGDSTAGVKGTTTASSPGKYAAGVKGSILSNSKNGSGVWGLHSGKGAGVSGSSRLGVGVAGSSADSIGVVGTHSATTGIFPGISAVSNSRSDSSAALVARLSSDSSGVNASAVVGINNTRTGKGNGLWGQHLGSGNAILGSTANGTGLRGTSVNAIGAAGIHSGITGVDPGVYGETRSTTANAVGIAGLVSSVSAGSNSAGVRGRNANTASNGSGVLGVHDGSGIGVLGTSERGTGVVGRAISTTAGATAQGVSGESQAPNGTGVYGTATHSTGRNYGVRALASGDSSIAIHGTNSNASANAYAGYFQGKLNVQGNITRTYGTGAASERSAAPIAYGSVNANGTIANGTPNFEASWSNAGYYVVNIPGTPYSNASFTVTVTPITGNPLFAVANEMPGNVLQIRLYNLSGQQVQSPFSFIIYRPQ